MKTIAIMNLKGGVAKTVTTVNLAADLAHFHQKRVLVIDADSQANATEFLGGGREGHSLATLLRTPAIERTSFTADFEAHQTISASTVRLCLQNGDLEALRALVPASTLAYFESDEAAPVLQRIRSAKEVVHY